MRQQLIITFFLFLTLCISLLLRLLFFPKLDGHTAYYFRSTFWICTILITILSMNMGYTYFVSSKKGGSRHSPNAFWPNRRETFRILYPEFVQPTMVVEEADGNTKRQLEFPIVDLSQEGGCFIDDGCLADVGTFSGHIRLNSGDTIRITGKQIHKKGNHVSVQFDRPIDWSILLKEQRRLLVHTKPIPKHLS